MRTLPSLNVAKTHVYRMSLQTRVPPADRAGKEFLIQVSQQNPRGDTVGGAAAVYIVK